MMNNNNNLIVKLKKKNNKQRSSRLTYSSPNTSLYILPPLLHHFFHSFTVFSIQYINYIDNNPSPGLITMTMLKESHIVIFSLRLSIVAIKGLCHS